MNVLAIELSDRALALAQDSRVLGVRPSVVFEGGTDGEAGEPAWHALRRAPTAVSTRHLGQVLSGELAPRAAALLAAELAWRLREAGGQDRDQTREDNSALWLTVPAQAHPEGLSALLGLTRTLGLTISGFVDAATVQVAALALEQPALVLELGLHHLAASLVERGGESYASRRGVAAAGGWLELLAAWAELVGRTLVKQTRFDPLHEAASEQLLYDGLPDLVARALLDGSASFAMPHAAVPKDVSGETLSVVISCDQLAQAAQGLRREVMRLVHGLRPAGRPLCLLAPEVLLGVPGLKDDLESLTGCELIGLPPGFAALSTTAVTLPPRAAGEPVRLLRRLPGCVPQLTAPGVTRMTLGVRRAAAPPPSHVLWGGEAYPLNTRAAKASNVALVVGCDPAEEEGRAVLRLGPGLAGISRRHCSFLVVGGTAGAECVLLDHSRYGTFVNGERVAERARVHAGDRVRLGDPGVELALIAVPLTAAQATV